MAEIANFISVLWKVQVCFVFQPLVPNQNTIHELLMKPTIQTKQSFNHDEKRLIEEDFHKLSSSSDVQKDCTADTMSQAKPSVPQ